MSRIYPLRLACPRFGSSGEPSGTRERMSPLLSSSMHAYGRRLSTMSSFVCGPAAARKCFKIL